MKEGGEISSIILYIEATNSHSGAALPEGYIADTIQDIQLANASWNGEI